MSDLPLDPEFRRGSESGSAKGDPIARLLRLAGPRPSVPEGTTQRVHDRTHQEWRQAIAARRRRKLMAWSGGLLATAAAVLAAVMLSPGVRPTREPVPVAIQAARIQAVSGFVTAFAADATAAATVRSGDTLLGGTRVETGPLGRAALELAEGVSLRLDYDTRLQLISDRVVALERGALYVDSGERGNHASDITAIEIRTDLGTVHDIGTQFEVRLGDGGMSIRVREGLVNLDSDGEDFSATAGIELKMTSNGQLTRHEAPLYGPAWDWVLAIAPPFALEGHTLGSFLSWVGRETGWELRFADRNLAASAPEVVLHGSVEGLRPDQALDAVLPTCGLKHRVESGVLTVEANVF